MNNFLSRLRTPPSGGPNRRKVFCVGLQKTGTTTFQHAMEAFGYRHKGNSPREFKAWQKGDKAPIEALLSRYDSFDDVPFFLIYKDLFEKFQTDALFILTTRSSPEVWIKSVKKHALRSNPESTNFRQIYGWPYPHGYESEFAKFYQDHQKTVIDFFREKNASANLLKVCWETGDGWTQLAKFLNMPEPATAFPHSRRADDAKSDPQRETENMIRANHQMLERLMENSENRKA